MRLMQLLETGDLAEALVPACRVVAMLRTSHKVRDVLLPLVSDGRVRPKTLGVVLAVAYKNRAKDLENIAADLLRWKCSTGMHVRAYRGVHVAPLLDSIWRAAVCDTDWGGPKVLALEGCYMGASGAGVLGNLLIHLRCLQHLHLKGNDIGDHGMESLADACGWDDGDTVRGLQLQTLGLGSNNIRKKGAICLSRLMISANMTSLKHLDLSDNQLGNLSSSDLQGAMSYNTSLCILDLSATNLNGRFTGASLVQRVHSLRELNLSSCNMLDSGAAQLASALCSLPRLERLEVNSNGLKGGKGTFALVAALGRMASLHTLSMNRMQLKEKDIRSLLHSLSQLSGVRTLSLAFITADSASVATGAPVPVDATECASGRHTCNTYDSWRRYWSKDRSYSLWKSLSALLEQCAHLRHLDLQGNALGDGGAAAVAELVCGCVGSGERQRKGVGQGLVSQEGTSRKGPLLRLLDLQANCISDKGVLLLASAAASAAEAGGVSCSGGALHPPPHNEAMPQSSPDSLGRRGGEGSGHTRRSDFQSTIDLRGNEWGTLSLGALAEKFEHTPHSRCPGSSGAELQASQHLQLLGLVSVCPLTRQKLHVH
jgi:Ran GTPase-activating protein (RanGAP) involved in mRNA processing and transport